MIRTPPKGAKLTDKDGHRHGRSAGYVTNPKSPQFYNEQEIERAREDNAMESTDDENAEKEDLGGRNEDLETGLPHPNPHPQDAVTAEMISLCPSEISLLNIVVVFV